MVLETSINKITVGEIVTADFRAAEVFKRAGIDFCCGGKKSLEQACTEKSLDPNLLVAELTKLDSMEERTFNFNEWTLDFLSDYIVNTHHKYVIRSLPNLVFYTGKIATVHGSNHPELIEIAEIIEKVNEELRQHLRNEEDVLFPAIKEVLRNDSPEARLTIQSEINRMLGEHDFAGGSLDYINSLTNDYELPADACNTYQVAFNLLKQFEDDLHIHVHLENNILFPKALKL